MQESLWQKWLRPGASLSSSGAKAAPCPAAEEYLSRDKAGHLRSKELSLYDNSSTCIEAGKGAVDMVGEGWMCMKAIATAAAVWAPQQVLSLPTTFAWPPMESKLEFEAALKVIRLPTSSAIHWSAAHIVINSQSTLELKSLDQISTRHR